MNATVTQDMSLFHLIGSASLPVQLVMMLLLLTSFLSWWYIFRKLFVIRQAMRQSDEFENVFWKGPDLNAL
jgi:biopolymer transport protein TolQ